MWEENQKSIIKPQENTNPKNVRWRNEPPPSPPPSRKKKWSLWNFFPYHRSSVSNKNIPTSLTSETNNIPLVRYPETDEANETTDIYGGKKSRRRRIRKSKKSRRKREKSRRKSGKSRAKRRSKGRRRTQRAAKVFQRS